MAEISGTFEAKQIHELVSLSKITGSEYILIDDGNHTLKTGMDSVLGYISQEIIEKLKEEGFGPGSGGTGSGDGGGDTTGGGKVTWDDFYTYIETNLMKQFPAKAILFSKEPTMADVFKERFGGKWEIIGYVYTREGNRYYQLYLYEKTEEDPTYGSGGASTGGTVAGSGGAVTWDEFTTYVNSNLSKKLPIGTILFSRDASMQALFHERLYGTWDILGAVKALIDGKSEDVYLYEKTAEDPVAATVSDEAADHLADPWYDGFDTSPTIDKPSASPGTSGGGGSSGAGTGTGTGSSTGSSTGESGSGSSSSGGGSTIHVIAEGEDDIPLESRKNGHFYLRTVRAADVQAYSGLPRIIKVGGNMQLRLVTD